MKKNVYIILVSILVILSTSCLDEKTLELHSFNGGTMGTTYNIKIVKDSYPLLIDYVSIQPKVDSILLDINRMMSTYLPNSEISTFNSSIDTTWTTVSKDFAFVVDASLKMGYLSHGALDITVGPVVNLWGFGPGGAPSIIPEQSAIDEKIKLVGLDKILADTLESKIKKKSPLVYCDLSATAKGFGVDMIGQFLKSVGAVRFMVEIGGEVTTSGLNHRGDKWVIGVADPNTTNNIQKIVNLSNYSMATSGDYWNYFEENGIRYSHTIDPKTGRPITHKLASVSVIDPSCMMADGYATAINVLGPEKGYDFALENYLPVFLIIKDKEEFIIKMTPQFEAFIK
ncbi:MAG: FAD:protein FMN transferase [Bacteroidetes bacterium]|nr:FAD:protein FMN transferase [Bacteroidota bacterium]MBU1678060.1 FAD:protein FMN transferase [Bacteroidota bacterium]MBU2506342.1 FAD:protein FMN transferase [Bacteroidota bacterium]